MAGEHRGAPSGQRGGMLRGRSNRQEPLEMPTDVEAEITGNVWKIEKQAGESVEALNRRISAGVSVLF